LAIYWVTLGNPSYTEYHSGNGDDRHKVDAPSAYYKEAREKAMDNAKGKAEQIAGLAGIKLGEPTYVNESATTPYYGCKGYEIWRYLCPHRLQS
jgi:hypothetical protein